MRTHVPRVLDASALVALFGAYPALLGLMRRAEQGWLHLLLPTTAMAEAEASLEAGFSGWSAILMTPGLRSLPLNEHVAIDIGTWPGSLAARHAAHEAAAVRGTVITRDPAAYQGLKVPLLVI